VHEDIAAEKLKADLLIGSLFGLAHRIETTDALFAAASRRVALGNPPGKAGSLGDALNWEALLVEVPTNEDLHFITDDRDYSSALDSAAMNPFLVKEWKERKESNLWFYKNLSAFFRDHYPNIKLEMESQKGALIEALANSPTFASTHAIVAGLSKHADFTPEQANGIVNAANTNSQVGWICGDPDVKELLMRVIAANNSQIDPDACRNALALLGEPMASDSEGAIVVTHDVPV
jgi:hypothetical protein